MKKRVLTLALALVMALALLPTSALAAAYEFEIRDGELLRCVGEGGNVTIPEGVTSIGYKAFSGCKNLTSVTIPESVTSIRGEAFFGCKNLTSVTIPASVTSIDVDAFIDCENLTSIEVGEGDSVYSSQDGVLFNKEKTELVLYPRGKTGPYAVPTSVTSIGHRAFSGCKNLTSVTIPDSVTSIGGSAFYGCESLTSVTIPESVTSIEGCAFYGCESLTSVTIPAGMTSIGCEAFSFCGLTSVTLPASLREMGDGAFSNCSNLYSVALEEGATVIGTGAFYGCKNLTEVQIPNTVTKIGDVPFGYNCPWMDSEEWKIVSGYLLSYRGTDSVVTVPEGVVTIDAAFAGNKNITEVTLPDTVTRIGCASFQDCPNLKRVNVPASVQRIDYDVYFDSFYESPNAEIHCPPGSYTDTKVPRKKYYTIVADLPWTAPKSAYAATQPILVGGRTVKPTQTVLVDGEKVEFQMYALKDESGNPTNYVKLRDVASVLNGTAAQFEVGWDKEGVTITTGKPYTPNGSEMSIPFSGDRVYERPTGQTRVNGSPVDLDAIVLADNRGGQYTYYKLRDLGAALGFTVDWSKENGVMISTK